MECCSTPSDFALLWFCVQLSEDQLRTFLATVGKTIIHELEVLPVLVSRLVWAARIDGSSYLCFIDNEAAKACLVASFSHNSLACSMTAAIADLDTDSRTLVWYERVPSLSNPADDPSRGIVPPAVPGWQAPIESSATDIVATLLTRMGRAEQRLA